MDLGFGDGLAAAHDLPEPAICGGEALLLDDRERGEVDRALDLGIEGAGFFTIKLPDGTSAYTRDGSFTTDGTGRSS